LQGNIPQELILLDRNQKGQNHPTHCARNLCDVLVKAEELLGVLGFLFNGSLELLVASGF